MRDYFHGVSEFRGFGVSVRTALPSELANHVGEVLL